VPRREYIIDLIINGRQLKRLIIDPHYEVKHGDSVSDKIIIDLVKELDGGFYRVEKVDGQGFQYFVEDHLELNNKLYKLIWLLHDDEIFIGVVNCYRRN
jgi:hypothetical protein